MGLRPPSDFDMDGTSVEWSAPFAEILLERDPTFPLPAVGKRVGFDYFWVEGVDRELVMAALNDPRLYQNMEPLPYMREAVDEMMAAGVDVFFASAPTWTNPGCVPGKLADANRIFGEGSDKRLILTHDKTVLNLDVLADDKPEIDGAHTPTWVHAMYHQDYNQRIKTPHRITDWREWKDVIMPILERSQAA